MTNKPRFSIGAKLVIIVSAVFLPSLGLINFLSTRSALAEAERTAAANTRGVNEVSVKAAEAKLSTIRSSVSGLLADIAMINADRPVGDRPVGSSTAVDVPAAVPVTTDTSGPVAGAGGADTGGSGTGGTGVSSVITGMTEFFFSQHPDIAAFVRLGGDTRAGDTRVGSTGLGGTDLGGTGGTGAVVNEEFFRMNALPKEGLGIFRSAALAALADIPADGTLIINASSAFNGLPLLAIVFPLEGTDGGRARILALFTAESMADSFGTGAVKTFIIDRRGNALIRPKSGDEEAELPNAPFIAGYIAREEDETARRFADADGREYFGAARKLGFADASAVSFTEADAVFAGVKSAARVGVCLSIGAWLLAALAAWLFSRNISRPLEELREAAEKIEAGDFRLDLQTKRRDEIGQLAAGVQAMAAALRGK
jgi:HAMP domain-containing protein